MKRKFLIAGLMIAAIATGCAKDLGQNRTTRGGKSRPPIDFTGKGGSVQLITQKMDCRGDVNGTRFNGAFNPGNPANFILDDTEVGQSIPMTCNSIVEGEYKAYDCMDSAQEFDLWIDTTDTYDGVYFTVELYRQLPSQFEFVQNMTCYIY